MSNTKENHDALLASKKEEDGILHALLEQELSKYHAVEAAETSSDRDRLEQEAHRFTATIVHPQALKVWDLDKKMHKADVQAIVSGLEVEDEDMDAIEDNLFQGLNDLNFEDNGAADVDVDAILDTVFQDLNDLNFDGDGGEVEGGVAGENEQQDRGQIRVFRYGAAQEQRGGLVVQLPENH